MQDAQSQHNLKQIGEALHFCNDARGELPPAAVYDQTGKPLYSWRVLLLPYLGETDLYSQFHLDEPWDSPHNIHFLARMPKVYQAPGITTAGQGLTFYQVFTGPETPFFTAASGLQPYLVHRGLELRAPWRSRIPATFQNGTSNTFAVVEAADPVPWTKPADLVYDPQRPFPRLGGVFKDHFNMLFFDASARRIEQGIGEKFLRDHISPNGGNEILGTNW
jgi:hypothetical protein